MAGDNQGLPTPASMDDTGGGSDRTQDPKRKALASGLELSKRAIQSESLDELLFILTNDIHSLVPFDRAVIITHFRGKSRFAAATNQPVLQEKSKFFGAVTELAQLLRELDRGFLLAKDADAGQLSEADLPAETREILVSFMDSSGCAFLLGVPLKHGNNVLAHVLLEFHEGTMPDRIGILTLLSIAPFLASALSEKWLLEQQPRLRELIAAPGRSSGRRIGGRALCVLGGLLVTAAVLLFVPVRLTVGGEAEITPRDKHVAFVKIDGLIDEIRVTEGSSVKKGQVLAVLDRKGLDHEIRVAERKSEVSTQEMVLLKRESGNEPAKLAESQLVELKRTSVLEELNYLKWKTRFIEVTAPAAGTVITKEVETLVGKKFRAGEPFCEIVAPDDLWVVVYVPEERISSVRNGQKGVIYLNNEPGTGYGVRVAEIAPMAAVLPRLGNVYPVKAAFESAPNYIKAGMRGIGKIEAGESGILAAMARRLIMRWNQFSLYI
ncbi:MAG: HlyD family efflux transporter periplasmic adaptor subunit [Pseudomonadota bacterium]